MESYILEILKNLNMPILIIPENMIRNKTNLQKALENKYKEKKTFEPFTA